ncbi:glutamate decarboxylase [Cladophialophora psammophila CBS 110553]|uniref:Glutamate decarboxylase n=1 Tax=Cladophialophora psammophila CBS 110553 TaxID=1182543 RepID=W9X8V0_9EURO|nr:glutamate decarboxylase [Cladophialophora psammophila CBS 110553]EXJ73770.1 glutamate decarboxylase [Cladophialophora psammophila CBS 110553]
MSDHPLEGSVNGLTSSNALHSNRLSQVSNGIKGGSVDDAFMSRADELQNLLASVLGRLIPFIRQAESERKAHQLRQPVSTSSILEPHSPSELLSILTSNGTLSLPDRGTGPHGLVNSLSSILKYSVNTSAPGFLDKLYSAPLPPGIAADLILSVLNTNVHVYQVSPVLSLIETHVTKALAATFGFLGPRAGGINVQGGSASNMTSIVIARNTLFPDTKQSGNHAGGRQLVMFTSEHGHYSIEKAAQQCGFGAESVIPVPVHPSSGEMDPEALESLIVREKSRGKTPFYVNATAGTTVLGSFDPFPAVAQIAGKHGLWMHIDGAWGGSLVFSDSLRHTRLKGCELADSIAVNPHKMLGVPVTCSFLLLKDLKNAHTANTLRAGYLFHDGNEDELQAEQQELNGHDRLESSDEDWAAPDDLADLTLQCGRRGDSLKLFLSWQYYGTLGYTSKVETAYSTACYLADLVDQSPDLLLVSTNPPPCLQVCFYFAPGGKMLCDSPTIGNDDAQGYGSNGEDKDIDVVMDRRSKASKRNSAVTSRIARSLVSRGFMVDYAPALSHEVEMGSFVRAVVNISTTRETVRRLVEEVRSCGREEISRAWSS